MRPKPPRKKRLDLWFRVEQMIGRGDLVVCGDDLIWFHDPDDAIAQELGQLLWEWKVELIRLVQKDAGARARAARGGG
jgi:hypothetical protein